MKQLALLFISTLGLIYGESTSNKVACYVFGQRTKEKPPVLG